MFSDLLSRRLVLVTGKGGVGKTTIATALALHASQRERRRVLLVELEAQQSVAARFGKPPARYEPAEIAPGLWAANITGLEAIRDYLRIVVPVGLIVDRITAHPLYRYFTDAAPGIRELLTFGKIWKLWDEKVRGKRAYDLIIVDCFPTGQTLNMFRAPIEVVGTLGMGPIASKAKYLVNLIRDSRETAVLLVTLPEEMPVAETIELHAALTGEIKADVAGVAVNGVLPKIFAPEKLARPREIEGTLRGIMDELGVDGSHAAHAYRAAHEEMRRRQQHEHHLKRLVTELPGPFVHLPLLFGCDGARAVIDKMAAQIGREVASAPAARSAR